MSLSDDDLDIVVTDVAPLRPLAPNTSLSDITKVHLKSEKRDD
jgi:hypothetical protein